MLTQLADPSKLMTKRRSSWWQDLILIGMGSILIGLSGPLSFKLPFTPIPLSLAPHCCLALSLILGSKRAAAAVLLYLFQGIIGLPVFSLGSSGILHLLGPKGGYLFGYVAGTYLTGYLLEKMGEKTASRLFLALTFGNALIYALGVFQLSFFIGIKSAILMGVLPFLFGDLLKNFAICKTARKLRQWV